MKQTDVNNYIVDCIWEEKNALQWVDLTEEQQKECREYNS